MSLSAMDRGSEDSDHLHLLALEINAVVHWLLLFALGGSLRL